MRILLVEDDKKLNLSLKFQLEQEKFMVDACYDGEEALYYMNETIYDLILLDRMLPVRNGLSVLREMRGRGIQTPVILLTALGEVQDKIAGLDCGADDYLVKPFDFEELCARIRSILRRPRQLTASETLTFADLAYMPASLTLKGPDGSCLLSRREGALLETFLRNFSQSLSRSSLLIHVWGPDSDVEEGNLDNYIYFLRRRLKAVGSAAGIVTVRGIGYRLEENTQSS
ncbi:MAG: response regulator transcription factor [Eubacteriales bacterium]|nr:response regulator transcription factor [Eubacteriales bacterium]